MILYTELFCGQADIFLPAGSVNSAVWRQPRPGQVRSLSGGRYCRERPSKGDTVDGNICMRLDFNISLYFILSMD